ncbi:MAG: YbbR-like domain-containing protein, partial [bacterium]
MKILSLALALVVWGITRASDPYDERTLQPEVFVKLKPQTALLSRNPSNTHAMVRVKGRASMLDRLQTSNPRVLLDARSLGIGQTSAIKPKLEPNTRGITAEFEQIAYKISVDELTNAEFTPEQVTEGRLDSGFFLDSVNEDFSVVIVDGAKTLMDKVVKVVYVINLSLLTGSTRLTIQFEARDENNIKIDYLHITPASADITINLQPSQASKSVPIVPDFQGQPAANYAVTSISSEPFLGEVSGSTEALAKVVNLRTVPINLTGKTSSFEQSVNLLPSSDGISLLTSRVTVRVEIQQISSSA